MLVACSRCSAPRSSRAPADLRGHQLGHVVVECDPHLARQAADDFEPHGKVGQLDIAHQPARQPRHQLLAQRLQLARAMRSLASTICRPSAKQHVERVEQFVERRPLAREELDVVEQQQIGPATFLPEAGQSRAAQCFDEAGDELLGRQIDGPRARVRVRDTRRGSPAASASCRRPSDRRTSTGDACCKSAGGHFGRTNGIFVAGPDDHALQTSAPCARPASAPTGEVAPFGSHDRKRCRLRNDFRTRFRSRKWFIRRPSARFAGGAIAPDCRTKATHRPRIRHARRRPAGRLTTRTHVRGEISPQPIARESARRHDGQRSRRRGETPCAGRTTIRSDPGRSVSARRVRKSATTSISSMTTSCVL